MNEQEREAIEAESRGGPGPVPTQGSREAPSNSFGPSPEQQTWELRLLADRAFRILQGAELSHGGGPMLASVEIIDHMGRSASAGVHVGDDHKDVTIVVDAHDVASVPAFKERPPLADPQGDIDRELTRQAASPQQAAFESYWRTADGGAPGISGETIAREAFLAGLAHRDTGQPA